LNQRAALGIEFPQWGETCCRAVWKLEVRRSSGRMSRTRGQIWNLCRNNL